jgi:neutral ceramidase
MTDTLSIRAGVSRQSISPPRGIFLIGYGDRTKGNTGIHDDLTATALVLDDGRACLALVACDLLCLNEFVVDRVRNKVGPDTDVFIFCSHTHSGPIGYAGERSKPAERAYIDLLVERIAQAVNEAKTSQVSARLAWGRGETRGEAAIAVNRRERKPNGQMEIGENPDGPVDRSVNVISVTAETGEVLSTLVNFACHGTVLGPRNLLVSADWIGAMRSRVEAAGKGKVLFLQGATGNLNPRMGWDDDKGWGMLQSQGSAVGDAVLEVYQREMRPLQPAPLRAIRKEVWMPLEAPATTPTPPPTYRKRILSMGGLPSFLSFLTDILLDQRYPWRSRIEARQGVWSVPLRVNTARIGDLSLVTFGAEVFTEIGVAIKSTSPAPLTLFTSLTDGCIGYLFTAEAHAEGGYEVDVAPFAYRYPARLSRQCAALATLAALEGVGELYKT